MSTRAPDLVIEGGRHKLLLKHRIGTRVNPDECDMVVVTLGNAEMKMHYVDAAKFAQSIRIAAKHAKVLSGDLSSSISMVGLLTDSNAWERSVQEHRVATASYIPKNARADLTKG